VRRPGLGADAGGAGGGGGKSCPAGRLHGTASSPLTRSVAEDIAEDKSIPARASKLGQKPPKSPLDHDQFIPTCRWPETDVAYVKSVTMGD
jgi:hypothetical protein